MEIRVGLILKNSEGHRIEVTEILCKKDEDGWKTYVMHMSRRPNDFSARKCGLDIKGFEQFYLNSTYQKIRLVETIDA